MAARWDFLAGRKYGARRILAGAVLGVIVGFALHDVLRLPFRIAAGWIVAVAVYLLLTGLAIGAAGPEEVRRHARLQDPRRWIIMILIIAAAGVSLLALGFSFGKVAHETGVGLAERLIFAALTIVASWTLTHTIFALHYAHHFYGDDETVEGEQDRGGLDFPGKDLPDYWDFLYFSFVVGMTCQVSDVQIVSRAMRRLVLEHGVLAFFFNTFILALAVNFVAGSLG
ncbi:MAG TPA: DUF1345 domain-containing protein [Stellaceae bacterium]